MIFSCTIMFIAMALFLLKLVTALITHFQIAKFDFSGASVMLEDEELRLIETKNENKENAPTAVILPGWGNVFPSAEFFSLSEALKENFHVIIVERPGYGFCSDIHNERDIASVLTDTRSALHAYGITEKITLIPHSMGALEAMLWSQKYPDELNGIVYLDPCTPSFIEKLQPDKKKVLAIMGKALLGWLGFTRIIAAVYPKFFNLDKIDSSQRAAAAAMLDFNGMNTAIMDEYTHVKENGNHISAKDISEIPATAIIAENGLAATEQDYLEKNKINIVNVSGNHFVHYSHIDVIQAEAEKITH